jgi:hypothetical protein
MIRMKSDADFMNSDKNRAEKNGLEDRLKEQF